MQKQEKQNMTAENLEKVKLLARDLYDLEEERL